MVVTVTGGAGGGGGGDGSDGGGGPGAVASEHPDLSRAARCLE